MPTSRMQVLPVTNPDPQAQQLIATAWTPSSLGTNLLAWYKADVGVTLATGTNVSALADQSGNGGPTLNQATAGNQPLQVPASQNGLPMLDISSKWVYQSVQPFLRAAANSGQLNFVQTQPFSVGVAFRKYSPAGAGGIAGLFFAYYDTISTNMSGWHVGIANAAGTYYPRFSLFKGAYYASTGPCAAITGSRVLMNGVNYTMICTYDGTGKAAGMKIYVLGIPDTPTITNDALVGDPYSATSMMTIWPNLSNSACSVADQFFEGMVVNRLLTTAEIASMNAYLRQRWGF